MRRRTILSLLTTTALGVATSAISSEAEARPRARGYSVRLVDDRGRNLPTFWHQGKRWVLGEYGGGYAIRVQNHTSRRVEAVVTVDGRDAINGSPGNLKNRGYVLAPYGSVTISGFRKSLQAVAAFRFTSPGNSYSSRMGTPQNVGVIGVAFFPEKYRLKTPPHPVRPVPHPRRRAPSASAESPASPKSNSADRASGVGRGAGPNKGKKSSGSRSSSGRSRANLGTEYGQNQYSPVEEVVFRRASPKRAAQIQLLRYDDAEGLRARGIEPFPRPRPVKQVSPPQAFPESRFAPPPP